MKILFIFGISSGILGSLASHNDLASCLLLQLLLVVALGAYQQACIVEVAVLGQYDFPLYFGSVVHHGEDTGVEAHGKVATSFDEGETDAQIFVGRVEFLHEGQIFDLVLGAIEVLMQFGGKFCGLVVGGFIFLIRKPTAFLFLKNSQTMHTYSRRYLLLLVLRRRSWDLLRSFFLSLERDRDLSFSFRPISSLINNIKFKMV
jgi:hypothetical protein